LQKENQTISINNNQLNTLLSNGTRIFFEQKEKTLYSTITLKNGLMVKLLPNLEVLQSYENSFNKTDEIQRLILSKGSVIKYM